MKIRLLGCLLGLLTAGQARAQLNGFQITERVHVAVEKPAFMSVEAKENHLDLLISSFKPFGKDHIFKISNVKSVFDGTIPQVNSLTDKISWPNEVQSLAPNILGKAGYLICSGFLFPTKSTGAIDFFNPQDDSIQKITNDKQGYFYHRAVFADVSGSGRLDLISARSKIPVYGQKDGELIWLQRPSNPLTEKWNEVVLAKGPDIHFRVFEDRGQTYIVAAEFSIKRISLYWFEKNEKISGRIIDDTLGAPFDLDFFDLNNDGKKDLLATNHEKNNAASAFAYELPEDLKTGVWIRHTLLTGIETRQKGVNQASPGVAKAFFPDLKRAGQNKPWIIVSGDGSQRVHLLTPLSEGATDWHYKENIILDAKATVGEPLIGDFDGDGLADFIIPAYDSNLVYFLSLKKN